MSKLWITKKQHPIIAQMLKRCLGKTDVVKALQVDRQTFDSYLDNPYSIPLYKFITLCGILGISPEELLYLIIRNKPGLSNSGVWYIEEIREKYKDK